MTTKPHTDITDKVALITGAARRIGAETAYLLHANGINLILHYRTSRESAQALQNKLNAIRKDSVILIQANLLDTHKLSAVVKEATSAWGKLDILINNASSFYATPIGSVTDNQWEDLIGTNLKAPFFLSQAAAPHLRMTHGCIVNIADIHADRPLKHYPIYSVAKAGLVMLTKSLACELGPEVRVNAIAPGAIIWPENTMDDITKQRILSRTYLKRQGNPENIANAVLFLVRDALYTTGNILNVDGGRSLNT